MRMFVRKRVTTGETGLAGVVTGVTRVANAPYPFISGLAFNN